MPARSATPNRRDALLQVAAQALAALSGAGGLAALAGCGQAAPVRAAPAAPGEPGAPSAPGTAPRAALVIGNAGYAALPALRNPHHDAQDMAAALDRLGYATTRLLDVGTRAELEAAVRAHTARLRPGGVGITYYSGHGVQLRGANHLVPTRADLATANDDPARVLYGLHELFAEIGRRSPAFHLVVLDACRSDLFAPPGATAGTTAATPARAVASALQRSLRQQAVTAPGIRQVQEAPPATLVLYATAANDEAFDGSGRNGPLTQHVLRHLGTRGLPIDDFLKRVIRDVEADTARHYGRRQTPFIYGSFSGRFCLAGCADGGQVPPML